MFNYALLLERRGGEDRLKAIELLQQCATMAKSLPGAGRPSTAWVRPHSARAAYKSMVPKLTAFANG